MWLLRKEGGMFVFVWGPSLDMIYINVSTDGCFFFVFPGLEYMDEGEMTLRSSDILIVI